MRGRAMHHLALNSNGDIEDTNWDFLVFRLSEIDMFTEFVQSTPDKIDFYGFTLLKQSMIAIVPRIFWPSKPSTEELIMQRVYDAGVISRNSTVSAKPAFVVDAYLSDGATGVFISLLIYGMVCQFIAQKADTCWGLHLSFLACSRYFGGGLVLNLLSTPYSGVISPCMLFSGY
jgi:hypothetical protein